MKSMCCGTLFLLTIAAGRKVQAAVSYHAIHYGWEQGFTAATGYCLYEDSRGYLWISSETGLFRFNGTGFRKYTTRDGLPDKEILGIKEDADGRMWMLPYSGTLCYMRQGKIFHAGNDPLLARLRFNSRPEVLFFDKYKNTWIGTYSGFTCIDRYGKITQGPQKNKEKNNICRVAWIDGNGELEIILGDTIFTRKKQGFVATATFDTKMLTPRCTCIVQEHYVFDLIANHFYCRKPGGGLRYVPLHPALPPATVGIIPCFITKDTVMICSDKGAFLYDIPSGRLIHHFLPGYKVGDCVRTRDGSIWLVTAGKGVFRFRHTPVKTIDTAITGNAAVVFIKAKEKELYGATNNSRIISGQADEHGIYHCSVAVIDPDHSYKHYLYFTHNNAKQLFNINTASTYVTDISSGKTVKKVGMAPKTVLEEASGQLLIGAIEGVFRFDPVRFRITDTFLYLTRTVALEKQGDTIYAGTLNGLFAIGKDKAAHPVLPGNPLLQGHITAIADGGNGLLWVANSRAGLVGIRQGRVVAARDGNNGLFCNSISALKASDRFLWIATDNGLFAMSKEPPYALLKHVGAAAGLGSDQVNCLSVCGSRIWAGTTVGISYFDEDEIMQQRGHVSFVINSIKNGDSLLLPSGQVLPLQDKSLDIDMDLIDFSGGNVPLFQYRIDDKEWLDLNGNHLYFPSLPYGNFRLSVRTRVSGEGKEAVFCQQFYNPPPYYRTAWFVIFLVLIVLVAGSSIVFFAVKRIRQRDQDKMITQQHLLRLEQMALQGQMNPHFIFNCIAAIKQHYNAGNKERANSFVDAFSSLIRQTFEMGTETFVPLDKELDYLGRYLDVEKSRFNESFSYSIQTDITLPAHDIPVPAMLLQPFVENAVRHGIRHLSGNKGHVIIRIRQEEMQVLFEIEDNGIGIRRSAELKKRTTPESLTSSIVNNKRIGILNQLLAGKISLQVMEPVSCGTLVIISYPVNIDQQIIL